MLKTAIILSVIFLKTATASNIPCDQLYLQVENRAFRVVWSYPADAAPGTSVNFQSGVVGKEKHARCFAIHWELLQFRCNGETGQWDLQEGQIRKSNAILRPGDVCEIDYEEDNENLKVITKYEQDDEKPPPTYEPPTYEPPTYPPPTYPPPSEYPPQSTPTNKPPTYPPPTNKPPTNKPPTNYEPTFDKKDQTCAANPKCKGLDGNCCPTDSFVDLFCCDTTPAACAATPSCAHLDDDCCPTKDGVYLDCCDHSFRKCQAHPACGHLTGDCCPSPSGQFLDCCMPDPAVTNMDFNNNNNKIAAQCDANYECRGLADACCPTRDGTFLFCCGNYAPQCASHEKCKSLDGDCCPTLDGVYLDCCNDEFADAKAHPGCDDSLGKVCPDENGYIAECCLADPSLTDIQFEQVTSDDSGAATTVGGVAGVAAVLLV